MVKNIIVTLFILANMAFASGAMFEVSGREAPDTADIPYSPMLTGLYGDFTENDRKCAEWLGRAVIPIKADYNGQLLIMGYYDNKERVAYEYNHEHYLFLTEQNYELGEMVYGRSPGLRYFMPIPDLENYQEVARFENSVILRSK